MCARAQYEGGANNVYSPRIFDAEKSALALDNLSVTLGTFECLPIDLGHRRRQLSFTTSKEKS